MKVMFLGGASGIGASCAAVQIGERWVLVDAGIRMDPSADRLPDLSFLQDKLLAAIFVTHAHADHIGALPLVHQAFPAVPIYASRATMLLMEVMLSDALQVMERRAATEFEVPLYDEEMVTSTLHHLYPLPLNDTVTMAELPGVTIHTARAGHVAGAISIGFEAPDGRLLMSGDVSVTPQHTVPGAQIPTLKHPDLLVLESTYGARLHPNRQAEEERLALAVAEGIERGGHVLIPSFALGRAQEVLRILHMAQRRGQIPEFPVWVDGLVRRVCATYTAMPESLTPMLQRQIHRGYTPFFTGMVRAVPDARSRERCSRASHRVS
ncbi:MAG: MBL fold metallo-hydrolase [Chloroflexaceae bacterium]|nr:MBL fold metallo-hydrolase [Chloroflexaceae bacterium]